jgi:phage-related protein
MTEQPVELPVIFYRTANGGEPVRNWLRELTSQDRQQVGKDLAMVQYGWPVGMPLCRALGKGLWEVRSSISGNKIARILFCFHEGKIGIVHGFIKKTQKTPPEDLALARKRMKEMTQ